MGTLTVVFWNVGKRREVLPHLTCLAAKHAPDVFLLAECPDALAAEAQRLLSQVPSFVYREEYKGGSKVRAITRIEAASFFHQFSGVGGNLASWTLTAPDVRPAGEIVLAGVHLPSKAGGMSDADQMAVAQEVVLGLIDEEDRRGHRNTVVVGDFNMHPYDEGMTSVAGFHALMTRRLAALPDRLFLGRPRRRFYNPMWGLFGDRTDGPAGTYRWKASVAHNPHWNMFDQVLLRSGVMDRLSHLGILDHDGTHSLLDGDGFPDSELLTDHLPVLFRLEV